MESLLVLQASNASRPGPVFCLTSKQGKCGCFVRHQALTATVPGSALFQREPLLLVPRRRPAPRSGRVGREIRRGNARPPKCERGPLPLPVAGDMCGRGEVLLVGRLQGQDGSVVWELGQEAITKVVRSKQDTACLCSVC